MKDVSQGDVRSFVEFEMSGSSRFIPRGVTMLYTMGPFRSLTRIFHLTLTKIRTLIRLPVAVTSAARRMGITGAIILTRVHPSSGIFVVFFSCPGSFPFACFHCPQN